MLVIVPVELTPSSGIRRDAPQIVLVFFLVLFDFKTNRNKPEMVDATKSVMALLRGLGWWGAAGISLGLALVTLAFAAAIVVRWPVNQFHAQGPPPLWAHRHPIIRVVGLVGKNIAGYLTIFLGCVMAVPGVPGQGLLLILIGLTMLNFPGKRGLERMLIGRPAVLGVVNRLRRRWRRPPLEVDPG